MRGLFLLALVGCASPTTRPPALAQPCAALPSRPAPSAPLDPDPRSEPSRLVGTVIDAVTRQPMPGITVIAVPRLGRTLVHDAKTDSNGTYEIENLPAGIYIVSFTIADLRLERPDIRALPGIAATVDAALDTTKVGSEILITDRQQPLCIGDFPPLTTRSCESSYIDNVPQPGRDFEAAGAVPTSVPPASRVPPTVVQPKIRPCCGRCQAKAFIESTLKAEQSSPQRAMSGGSTRRGRLFLRISRGW